MASEVEAKLRQYVSQRARHRWEYCLFPEAHSGFPHQIDHIISRKHGGTSDEENLAYACAYCNRYKGSDLGSLKPGTEELVRLFHPRRQLWSDHFVLLGPIIEPRTAIGAVTTRLLRMNTAERIMERKALQSLQRYPRRWPENSVP